jgi:UDP-N-acetylglucosamine 2-epimerase (non-hydrolysing)
MIYLVAGARPNFMKIAPIAQEFARVGCHFRIIHTGQHYDKEMSASFFDDLELPKPDIYLGVGSGTHAVQTGKIMIAFEKVCNENPPDLVMVVGDVNSTIACALVAVKLGISVAHVEAGLRSFDWTMPEEINRILTDQISDLLFTTCEDANQNLIREGIDEEKIHFVGNVMIDTLLKHQDRANTATIKQRLGLQNAQAVSPYALLTLHRPSNVDQQNVLMQILEALNKIAEKMPIIFPIHPRTLKQIKKFNLEEMISLVDSSSSTGLDVKGRKKVLAVPPLGYLDFLSLMSTAKMVITDSGGIQEETTILGIPCLTLREHTERPVTVKEGTNIVVGNHPDNILKGAHSLLKTGIPTKNTPKYWDGRAARRIAEVLFHKF